MQELVDEGVMHIVFFDGECPFCHRAVRFLMERDQKQLFRFAPLQGETAHSLLKDPIPLDSLILLENWKSRRQRELRYGKGALRICWYLGGWWSLLGLLSFLPGFLADWAYKLVAARRHQLFKGRGQLDPDHPHLLP